MEYLSWRGDLNFFKDPFNDVDALIFALLSYLPFKDIVPGVESNNEISLRETSDRFFSEAKSSKPKSSNINPTASPSLDTELLELLRKAASCPRFADVRLSKYEENMDFVVGRQFGAITFTLPDAKRQKVVAFRGTDNSMIGWKEDFEIAYMEQVPAQESASQYLERAIGFLSGKVTVCGHSKGGNLAMYACSQLNAMRRRKLSKILNFDGPGFDFSVIPQASLLIVKAKFALTFPKNPS
jgi:hypothetical protein